MNISEAKKAGDVTARLRGCVMDSLKTAYNTLSDDILEIVDAADKIPSTNNSDAVVAFRVSVIELWESYNAAKTLISQNSCTAAWKALSKTKQCIKDAKMHLKVVQTGGVIQC